MVATTNAPFKTPSGNCPRPSPFKAQDITSMAFSTATSPDASMAVTTTFHQGSLTPFNAGLSLREQTLGSAKEALQTITDVAHMTVEHFKDQGSAIDKSMALQFALNHQQQQEQIHHQLQQEARHYMWEAQKSEQEERRHQENIETAREDKDWLLKLKKARDEALDAMIGSVKHGLLLSVAGRGLVFLYTTRKNTTDLIKSGFFTETVLYFKAMFIGQCSIDSSEDVIDSSSWWGYASTYITSYVPLVNVSCMAERIYSAASVLLGTATVGLLLYLIKKCFPSTVGRVFETAFVAGFLMMLSWTFFPWVKIAVAEALIYVPVFFYLLYMFHKARGSLKKDDKIPSSTQVDASIVAFDDVVQYMWWTPFLILVTSFLFNN